MLIARSPLRVSLAGGGTDLEAYYGEYGGAVLSTTIDKYFYVVITLSDTKHIQVSSSDYRTFYREPLDGPSLWDGDLRLPKAIIHHFGIRTGLSVFLASQVPPGTGLGSSSTVAVALVKAMALICGRQLTRHEVAELACQIEIDKLGMPSGKQDQYAAAFGGVNFFRFEPSGVAVERLDLPEETIQGLERRLMLFFTGQWHNSADILGQQKRSSERRDSDVIKSLHEIKDSALAMRRELLAGRLGAVGELLHQSWMAKRHLAAGITNEQIDRWYAQACAAGAAGGKVAGAGGGGFLLLYCEPERQDHVTKVMQESGLTRMDFRFEHGGAMVIMNNLGVGNELYAGALA